MNSTIDSGVPRIWVRGGFQMWDTALAEGQHKAGEVRRHAPPQKKKTFSKVK